MNTMKLDETSLRVLIVDDNRDGADALGMLIEELGNQVQVTYGGRQALEVASEYRPDLILVDLVMPDINGFDLVARLRQTSAFAQTKIVAVTGRKDEQFNIMAMKVGCNDVLVKPATLTVIKAVLASATPSISKPAT
jgi:PleD family two-component response regulator